MHWRIRSCARSLAEFPEDQSVMCLNSCQRNVMSEKCYTFNKVGPQLWPKINLGGSLIVAKKYFRGFTNHSS